MVRPALGNPGVVADGKRRFDDEEREREEPIRALPKKARRRIYVSICPSNVSKFFLDFRAGPYTTTIIPVSKKLN